jgi:hypothetical protein
MGFFDGRSPRFFADRRRAAIESDRSLCPRVDQELLCCRSFFHVSKAKTTTFATFLDFEAV